MDLEDLRAVQTDERSADSLQPLPDSFYADVGEFIEGLREQRDRAAERAADPFGSDEVRQLTDEIETAEEVVEAVYERRVGKVVKRASLAAAGLETDKEGLTAEETELFEQLVEDIQANRQRVLDVLAGELDVTDADDPGEREALVNTDSTPAEDTAPQEGAPEPPPEAAPSALAESAVEADPTEDPPTDGTTEEELDIADAMASDASTDGGTTAAPIDADPDPTAADTTPGTPDAQPPDPHAGASASIEGTDVADTAGAMPTNGEETTDRVTVRITQEVGEILGIDERVYDLDAEDVVSLPTANAEALLERDAAEAIYDSSV